jgi:hypothetical protein
MGVEVLAAVTTTRWLTVSGCKAKFTCGVAPAPALQDCSMGWNPSAVTASVPDAPGTPSKTNAPEESVVLSAE